MAASNAEGNNVPVPPRIPSSSGASASSRYVVSAFRSIFGLIAVGLLSILVFAWQATEPAKVFAVGVTIAGATLVASALLGFLFGIPRRLQRDAPKVVSGDAAALPEAQEQLLYGANTNLEEISDWLTKILIGVGLTQIGEAATLLRRIGETFGNGMGGAAYGPPFVIANIIYFAAAGFFLGFLWTRIYLGRALSDAERVTTMKKRLDDVERDVRALSYARKVLAGESDMPDQKELNNAIRDATTEMRTLIFYRAQGQRWQNNKRYNKPIMERTMPVFYALIESDRDDRLYHRNHGELAYVLKDKRNPNWIEAAKELTEAIDIRDKIGEGGWREYEFNRAVCRIKILTNELLPPDQLKDMKKDIEKDLDAARKDSTIEEWFKNKEWDGTRVIDEWEGLAPAT